MTGVFISLLSGLGYGAFQAFHRRAQVGIDIYRGTFILIAVSALVLSVLAALTEDLSLLAAAPPISLLHFTISGFVHFFLGWTLLGISQNTIGAARTGAAIGSVPLFAAVMAFLVLGEALSLLAIAGIALVMSGVYVISVQRAVREPGDSSAQPEKLAIPWLALSVAVLWAISPLFVRWGLEGLPSPLLGVTVSMYANTLGFGLLLLIRRPAWKDERIHSGGLRWEIAAAVFISLATWLRWVAIDLTEIAVVLALGRVNVPVVMLLSPVIVGGIKEQVSWVLWLGAALIVGGSLILSFV